MATIDVKDAAGATVAIEKPLVPGRAAAASSRPVALSTEDAAFLDGIEAALATLDGRVDGLETLVTSTNTKLDTVNTNLGTIDGRVDGLEAVQGTTAGAAVITDANGTMQQYGRGNIVLALATNTKLDTAIASLAALDDAGAGEYETVAASQTTQTLGATGATGDYIAGVLIIPATTSPGAVAIKDGANAAITVFTGGATSVSNLVPFVIPLGIRSVAGAWQVTTGANVSAIGIGNFT